MNDYENLKAQGIDDIETVGMILGDDAPEGANKVARILPPKFDDQPEFPDPGIYFGMSEDDYHAIPAFSSSGGKKLAVSSMDYWANSWLNPDKEEVERKHLDLGKAIHAFVLEGEDEYLGRFAIELDPEDYADQAVLTTADEIKAAIGKFTAEQPVKPVSGSKTEIVQQLKDLGSDNLDGTIPELKELIGEFTETVPVKPVSRVEEEREDGTTYSRAATKDDWIEQLLDLDPTAMIWDRMVAEHRAKHEGKTFIDARTDRRIRIAVKMIMAHDEISKAFTGGFPEVSIFWHCATTGVPMKARVDYLKMRAIVDLKSFGNNAGMPIDRAIERTIANYRYNLQQVQYDEGVQAAKAMIRAHGVKVIHGNERQVEFAKAWAMEETDPAFIFVFQQTGNAPVTRGKVMPRGTVFSVTRARHEELKRKWAVCAETFGTDPWLDIQPIDEIEDEAIPLHATEL